MGSPPNHGIKPSRAATSNALVASQLLTVSGSSSTSFASFNSATGIVVLEVKTANVLVTFDGSQPSSGTLRGHTLYPGKVYHWDPGTALVANFAQASTTATLFLSEFQIFTGDTQLPDTSVIKSLNPP